MAIEKSYFFDSVEDDRLYTAQEFLEFFSVFLSDGVKKPLGNNLLVKKYPSRTNFVEVEYGAALVDTHGYILGDDEQGPKLVSFADNETSSTRKDLVVVCCDNSLEERRVYITGVTGTEANLKERQENENITDLVLAEVEVKPGNIIGEITDKREAIRSLLDLDVNVMRQKFDDFMSELDADNYVTNQRVDERLAAEKAAILDKFDMHQNNEENPHKVTPAQINAVSAVEKAAANGVATLGSDGKLPAAQMPQLSTQYSDFNTATKEGIHSCISGALNAPEPTGSWTLIVTKESTGTKGMQIAIQSGTYKMFVRHFSGTVFSEWKKMWTQDNIIIQNTQPTVQNGAIWIKY